MTRFEPGERSVYEELSALIGRTPRGHALLAGREHDRSAGGRAAAGTGARGRGLGVDGDAPLAAALRTIATAESCTGGLLAARLTDLPGSSDYVTGGIVAYSNEVKVAQAGVPAELIERHGAVSGEVAAALAQGARTRLQADIGVGVTGVAGPGGGSEDKPVGLVWLSVAVAAERPAHALGESSRRQGRRARARHHRGDASDPPRAARRRGERRRRAGLKHGRRGDGARGHRAAVRRDRSAPRSPRGARRLGAPGGRGLGLRVAGGRTAPLRLLDAQSLHLTLCFLGERPAQEVDALDAALDACAVDVGQLSLGAPLWLPAKRARSLAVEVHDSAGELGGLYDELSRAIAAATTWAAERRRFRAHVTVARVRGSGRGARESFAGTRLPPTPRASFSPEALTLYRSSLAPGGAVYEVLASSRLLPREL